MATSRQAWGIDVGNRALKAIRIGRDGDGFRVEDFDIIEHETPLSQSGDNRDALIAKALAEFTSRHKTGSIPVGVSVSGQQSFARFVKLPPVEEKRVPEIVKFEAIQQIPFPLDDVEWSYQLFKKPDDPEVEVGIFAMRKELVNHHVDAYTGVKLNVQAVQMSPLAVYNGLYFDGKLNDGTTLIIDMGADTTDLIVADGEQIWHRSIPIGGNSFTETLVRGFKVDYAKAEAMKRDASASKYARQIFQAMRPVFADLVSEIQRSIGFYASTHRDAKIVKAIALGGTFKLPGLQKYLQQNLQIDVEVLKAFVAAPPTDAKLAALYEENVLSAGTAYGLAIQTMGEGKIVSSLLPSRIRTEKIWRDKTKYFVAAAALFVAAAGTAWFSAYVPMQLFNTESARQAQETIDQKLQEAQGLDGQWSTIESAGGDERTIVKNIRTLTAERTLWPQIVGLVQDALPKSQPNAASLPRRERINARLDGWESIYIRDIGPILSDPIRSRFFTEQPQVTSTGGEAAVDPSLSILFPNADNQGGGMGGRFGGAGMPRFEMPRFGGGGGGGGQSGQSDQPPVPPEVITAANGKPGFLLRITGVTPNANPAALLDRTFLRHLLDTRFAAAGTKPPHFYVADAFLIQQGALRDNPNRLNEMQLAYQNLLRMRTGNSGGGGSPMPTPGGMDGDMDRGFGGRPPGMPGFTPPTGQAQEDPTPYLDPVTKEDRRDDREFSVLAFVVIGTPPALPVAEGTPPPAAEGGTPAAHPPTAP